MQPQFLYRYRHLQGEHRQYTSRILTESVLYFASPKSLNDPFDCKVNFNSSVSDSSLRRLCTSLLKKSDPLLNRAKRRDIFLQSTKSRKSGKFLEGVTHDLQETVNNMGLLSLSASCNNILLWSHYAYGHAGLCLQFRHETSFFAQAQQVEYLVDFPKVNLCSTPKEQVTSFLLSKAIDWKYEEEWRIIDYDNGYGDKKFPEEILVGIILGARMPPQDKLDVAKWVKERKSPVKIYKASINKDSFSLDILDMN